MNRHGYIEIFSEVSFTDSRKDVSNSQNMYIVYSQNDTMVVDKSIFNPKFSLFKSFLNSGVRRIYFSRGRKKI